MAPLRAALEERGLEDVSTILQSGNVVFRTGEHESAVATLVGDTIEDAFGLRIAVIVRSAAELAARRRPQSLPRRRRQTRPRDTPRRLPRGAAAAAAIERLDPDRSPPDAFEVAGREVYLSYPGGSGRSRLTLAYLERALGVEGTARNWRTVQRLATALLATQAPGFLTDRR